MNIKESLVKQENLLEHLMSRFIFSWSEEKQITIEKLIRNNARREAEEKVTLLNTDAALSPIYILEKVNPRAESWRFGSLLGHFRLKRSLRLSSFTNLFVTEKINY